MNPSVAAILSGNFGLQIHETALLVIQIMPVKYSIVKDQMPSTTPEDTENHCSDVTPIQPPSASSYSLLMPFVMVGLGRFELPTSPLSGVRSNQLSYRPIDQRSNASLGFPGDK